MKHEIEVTISPAGDVEFHVEGMKGKGCLTVIKEFERELGKAVSTNATQEMYEAAPVETKKVRR